MGPPEEDGPTRGWHYTVSVDPQLAILDVRVCFVGRAPPVLTALRDDAFRALIDATDETTGEQLETQRGRRAIVLDGVPPGGCVRYGLALPRLEARASRWSSGDPADDAVLLRTSQWLYRPRAGIDDPEITARFELPAGMTASVAWDPLPDGRFRVDPTVYYWLGYTVLGRPSVRSLELEGGTLEVVQLGGPYAAGREGLDAYVRDAADAVASVYGRFPVNRAQVILVPVERGGGAVYFGRVARGGGTTVYLLVDTRARAEDLPGGWTTVHEFQHVGMPYVDDPWMSEGFASYYAEVLRTRMGHRNELDGWIALEKAFGRGRGRGRGMTLQATSDNLHRVFAYQRVYWSGAALGFLMDVALRKDSGGKRTLDDAMQELNRCCRHSPRRLAARALLQRLDAWYGKPLFSEIANAHLGARGFPDVSEAYRYLGVDVSGDEVVLRDDAPGADARRAIMAPRTTLQD